MKQNMVSVIAATCEDIIDIYHLTFPAHILYFYHPQVALGLSEFLDW